MKFLWENKEWLVGIIGGIFTFFAGLKMKKNNERLAELQNLKTLREVEKQLIEDMKKLIKEYQTVISKQKEIIENCNKKLELLKNKIKK